MTIFRFATQITGNIDNINLVNQTVDVGVSTGDPVYFDNANSIWKKSVLGLPPTGLFVGNNTIVLKNRAANLTGLTVNVWYYMADTGGLTTIETNTRIGYSISATELLVDIDSREKLKVAGYTVGPTLPTALSLIEKLVFSTELSEQLSTTISVTSNTISNTVAGLASPDNGYFAGGFVAPNFISNIDKFEFSSEMVAPLISTLANGNREATGMNSAAKGYIAGGEKAAPPAGAIASIQTLDFSDDSVGSISSILTSVRLSAASFQNIAIAGYVAGGVDTATPTPNQFSSITKLIFSNETKLGLSSNISTARSLVSGLNSFNKGYVVGSHVTAGSSNIDILVFATDNTSVATNQLTIDAANSPGTVNDIENGFIIGGGLTPVSSIDKLVFAIDSATRLLNSTAANSVVSRAINNASSFDG